MRDVIWTLIIVWLVYRVVAMFKGISSKKSAMHGQDQNHAQQQSSNKTTPPPEKDIKRAVQKHLNNEGEYVDFEEVK